MFWLGFLIGVIATIIIAFLIVWLKKIEIKVRDLPKLPELPVISETISSQEITPLASGTFTFENAISPQENKYEVVYPDTLLKELVDVTKELRDLFRVVAEWVKPSLKK